GLDDNFSWNCGVEGETDNAAILDLRRRQCKNYLATLLLSQGVPMLQAGDEFRRTQRGNNNAWCQDNIIGWVDWSLAERNADFHRFTREMIWLRKRHPALRRRWFFKDDPVLVEQAKEGKVSDFGPEIVWHGFEPFEPDFGSKSHSIAFALDGRQTLREPDCDFYVAIHAEMEAQNFHVPPSLSGRPWRRVVDTALASPQDIVPEDEGPPVAFGSRYLVAPFALVVLISKP
ncbi:MAG TPA: glycogen debranching enzyme, partial [Gemmataceae bacterium]|nr:glycogen debranching enzyme [Gemmataceae bacterium]